MKEHLSAAKEYRRDDFIRGVWNFDDNELLNLLKRLFSTGEPHIYQHDKDKREKRDNLFISIIELCNLKNHRNTEDYIVKKIRTAKLAEECFDKIKGSLKEHKISQLSIDDQVWSHIYFIDDKIHDLKESAKNQFKESIKNNGSAFIGSKRIKNEFGEDYDPDLLIERYVDSLSLTLTLLGYENGLFKEGYLVVPDIKDVSLENKQLSSETVNLAASWKMLNDVSARCMVFSGDSLSLEGNDIPEDARKSGITKTFHFIPEFSEFELADFISSHRVIEGNEQTFFEVVLEHDVSSYMVDSLSEISTIDENRFLYEKEISSLISLSSLYFDDAFSSQSTYEGLTLKEWVRCYACIEYLSSSNKYAYSRDEIVDTLKSGGISEERSNTFIKLATFGKNSRDLFDCPLIKMRDGGYFLPKNIISNISLYFPIVSRLSTLESEIKGKGKRFENEVLTKLLDHNILAKSFKFKREGNEYEYDVVFIIDKTVFIVECKNRTLPCWNPIRGVRFKSFVDSTVDQVVRLKNGLIKYPEVFYKEFGEDIQDYSLVPIILNCQPFSLSGKYRGVYVNDSSSLGKFFQSKIIYFKQYKGISKAPISEEVLIRQWEGDRPSARELLDHLENSPQLRVYSNSVSDISDWLPLSKECWFTTRDYVFDLKKGYDSILSGGLHHSNNGETAKTSKKKIKLKASNKRKRKRNKSLRKKTNKRKAIYDIQKNSRKANRNRR